MDPIAAARDILPFWIGWLSLILLPPFMALCVAASVYLGGLVSITPYRRLKPDEWTAKARLLWPHRLGMGTSSFLFPVLAGVLAAYNHTPLSPLPAGVAALLSGTAAFAAVQVVALQFERSYTLRVSTIRPRDWVIGPLSYALIMFPHVVYGSLVGLLSPSSLGWVFAVMFVTGAVALTLTLRYGSMLLASRLGVAQPADARLTAIVGEAVARTGAAPPESNWVVSWRMANAFALPAHRALLFTKPAMDALDDAQLTAIAAHELGHLDEPSSAWLGRFGVIYLIYTFMATLGVLIATSWLAVLIGLVMVLAAVVTLQRVGRAMEERSDDMGHAHEGDPGTYASALEELYRFNLMPVVMGDSKRPHPDLYDRMIKAGVTPDYPRPEPPSKRWFNAGGVVSLIVFVVLCTSLLVNIMFIPIEDTSSIHLKIALQSEVAWELSELALNRYQENDLQGSATLYAAAEQLSDNPYYGLNLALTQANMGACDDAVLTLARVTEADGETGDLSEDPSLSQLHLNAKQAIDGCKPMKTDPAP